MEVFTQMGLWIWSAVVVVFFHACDGQNVFNPPPMLITVGVVVNGSTKIAETNQNFICATLDWWPPEKCDYGRCSWIKSSILNLVNICSLFSLFLVLHCEFNGHPFYSGNMST